MDSDAGCGCTETTASSEPSTWGQQGDAVDRPDRRMFAVDDGESWKLVMEPSVDKVRVRKRISWAEAT